MIAVGSRAWVPPSFLVEHGEDVTLAMEPHHVIDVDEPADLVLLEGLDGVWIPLSICTPEES